MTTTSSWKEKRATYCKIYYTQFFSPLMKNMTYSTFLVSFLSVADDCDMVCNPPQLYVQVPRSVSGLQNAPDSHWLLKRIKGYRCTSFSAFHFSIIGVLRPSVLAITTTHCTVDHHMSMAWRITAKLYVLNLNWSQSDPDLYPEMQCNFLATGLTLNCKSHLYQFCSSVSVLQKRP